VVLVFADQAEVVEEAGGDGAVAPSVWMRMRGASRSSFSALSRWPRWNSEEPIVARS
jgi:hypothetical protein